MPSLSETIAKLSALRPLSVPGHGGGADRLAELGAFGSNPGALHARIYVPERLPEGAALVVVLHGCTQTAADYDTGSGWSQLADRHGFALLFPEQQRQNNPNLCFNWFSPADNRRGKGEALSIRQMVAAISAAQAIDPARVFVTGLSAGGAMAGVMLATYPEVFAGGAIIAGLPYGCATSVPEAFERMRGHGGPVAADLAQLVRGASDHAGPWPVLSIWHGSSDATVDPVNAGQIIDQWQALHGLDAAPSRVETVDGAARRVWCDAAGRAVIEEFRIAGMGHGTPLATAGADGCGARGPFMLEAGISSTRHICRFWGLLDHASVAPMPDPATPIAEPETTKAALPVPAAMSPGRLHRLKNAPQSPVASGVGKIIDDALRAAGLMR